MIAGIMDPERGGSSTSPPNGSSASPRRRTSSGPNSIPPRPGRRPRRPAGMSGDRAWTSCRTADTGRSTRIGRLPPAPARLPGLGRRGRRLHAGCERKADHATAKPGLCRGGNHPPRRMARLRPAHHGSGGGGRHRLVAGLPHGRPQAAHPGGPGQRRRRRLLRLGRSPTATRWNGSPPGWTGPASGWRPCRGRRPTDARWGAACASSIRRATAMKPLRSRAGGSRIPPGAPCRAFAPVRWAWAMSCSWRNASKTCFLLCRRARIPPERLHAASLQGLFLPHQRAAP